MKELFEKPSIQSKKRNRYELFRRIDMDYYGYRDEEDGILVPLETKAEAEALVEAEEEWERVRAAKEEAKRRVASGEEASVRSTAEGGEEGAGAPGEGTEGGEVRAAGGGREKGSGGRGAGVGERQFVAHVPLPDEKEIERMVLEKKKAELLSKYASEDLVKGEQEAKKLLNIQS